MQQTNLVIENGTAVSGEVDVRQLLVCGIYMPSSWTTADLTFQVADTNADGDAGTYVDFYTDDGSEYTVQAAASRYISIDPNRFAGVAWLKVRSGTTGTPVNQDADRTVKLVCLPV